MTRQIAQDPGPTGEEDGFDLSRMTAREVAAELVRRHQALQARRGIANPARMIDAASSAVQPTALPAASEFYPAPEPVEAEAAGDGFWHLDRTMHVPSSMPMLAARDAFGAIAKLEAAAQQGQGVPVARDPKVTIAALTADQGKLVSRDRPVRYDPLDQPVEPFMPASARVAEAPRQREPATATLSTGEVSLPDRQSAKFRMGFAWGMIAGALTMVILLAVEIAVYPSLHLPARLHQLRALITSRAGDGDTLPARLSATTPPAATSAQMPLPTLSVMPELSRPKPVLRAQGHMEATLDLAPAASDAAASPAIAARPEAPAPPAATAISSATGPGAVEIDRRGAIAATNPPAAPATAKPKSNTPVVKATSASLQRVKSIPARAKAIAALLDAQLSGAKR